MARRTAKKSSARPRKATAHQALEISSPPAASQTPSGGGSFWKFFILIIVILVVLDFSSIWKKGFKLPKKYFVVKKVVEFTGTETAGKPFSAWGVAAVGSDQLALVDNSGCRVLIYDFNGKLIRQWGKLGNKGPFELHEPSSVVSDRQGHIYVMDTWNGAIKGYDLKGKSIGIIDLNHQGFYGPRNISWGGSFFLVSDTASYRLAKVGLDGQLLASVGGKGSEKGKFMGLTGTLVDDKGNWYAGDAGGNNRVEVFDASGKCIRVIKAGVAAQNLALGPQGELFVGCWGDPSEVFDSTGGFLGTLAEESTPETPINSIQGLDITPDGLILTSGGDQVTLYRIVEKK